MGNTEHQNAWPTSGPERGQPYPPLALVPHLSRLATLSMNFQMIRIGVFRLRHGNLFDGTDLRLKAIKTCHILGICCILLILLIHTAMILEAHAPDWVQRGQRVPEPQFTLPSMFPDRIDDDNKVLSVFSSGPEWGLLVARVQAGEADAVELLYRELSGFRRYFQRYIRNGEHDDAYQELILDLIRQFRLGLLREPSRLVGYARVMAGRKVARYIWCLSHSRNSEREAGDIPWLRDQAEDPEAAAIRQEQLLIAKRVLKAMLPREREVIHRFYLEEQAPDHICEEMGLTSTQFRLLKSRAKARFIQHCESRLAG